MVFNGCWFIWFGPFGPVLRGGGKKVINTQANMQLLTAGLFKYVWPFLTTRHEKVKAVYFSFAYDLFGKAVYIDSCSVLVQIQFMFHYDKNIFINEQKKRFQVITWLMP